jgi:hypothetical protein
MDDHHFFHIFLWTIGMFFPSSDGLPLFPPLHMDDCHVFLHLPMDDHHFFSIFLWMIAFFFPRLPMDDRHFFPIFLWMIVSVSTSFYG